MRVLVVSSRFPWPSHTGDRLRTTLWLDALSPRASVALVCPPGPVPRNAPFFEYHPAGPSLPAALANGASVVRRSLPLQVLLAARYDWKRAIGEASRSLGGFDAAVVLLSRLDPLVRESIHCPAVLDAVDSLQLNAVERRREAAGLARPLWRIEERRLRVLEKSAGRRYDRTLVVNAEEAEAFDAGTMAIGNGVKIRSLQPLAPRQFDFGFWGRLGYFANEDAALWLLDEIWPRIRAVRPDATLVIGGADAPRSVRRAAARQRVPLKSPLRDPAAFARSVRVALLPLRFGTGQSNKTLEAAEAGCALAGTPAAVRGLRHLEPHCRIAPDAGGLAAAAVELLEDHALRQGMILGLRRAVTANYDREQSLRALVEVVESVAEVRSPALMRGTA